MISDNGPQYTSDLYADFAKSYQFQHVTASLYFPQGNGEAERAVGTIKSMLKKCSDPYLTLLAYRSTPLPVGYNPAELLMSSTLRSTVPTSHTKRVPKIPNPDTVRANDTKLKARQKANCDSHHGALFFSPLSPGESVWIADHQTKASVDREVGPQLLEVTSADGTYRRNRRDLILLPTSNNSPAEEPDSSKSGDQAPVVEQPWRSARACRPPERLDPSWVQNEQ